MSTIRIVMVAGFATIGLAAAAAKMATAATDPKPLGGLSSNEGIYVDPKSFNIAKGLAKTDPSAQLMKLGAREVSSGAIIFRAGDKLYLVDADPSSPNLLRSFTDAFAPPG